MNSGTVDKLKGPLKEAAGALLADRKLKREGQADQLVGKLKEASLNKEDTSCTMEPVA